MAHYEFKLPDLGEGVAQGEIVGWLVRSGEAVREDQPIVEVMTDKATVVIAAPHAGRVVEIRAEKGATVPVGAVLFVLETEDRAAAVAASACGDIREDLPGIGARPLATPATRKLARDLNVDLRAVAPTGLSGRVTTEDIRTFATAQARDHATTPRAAAQRPAPVKAEPPPREERVPLRGLRKRIFDNMSVSKANAAHSTFVEECDAAALKALRERLRPRALEKGVKLSYLPIIVKAVVAALTAHPRLNATFDEGAQEIVLRRYYNIGIATATDEGLMVPVVHDAGDRTLLEIAREIERLAEDARRQRMRAGDIGGGTFTITSLGPIGGLLATPVIRYPEVAILGVHRIKQKPVVKDGQIAIGDVMLLSLSFDHRLVDGHVAAAFVYEVIAYLEHPETLLLGS